MSTTSTIRHSKANDPQAAAENSSRSGKAGRHPADDLVEYVVAYSRERPEIAALWCLGIGFLLGWKLKFW